MYMDSIYNISFGLVITAIVIGFGVFVKNMFSKTGKQQQNVNLVAVFAFLILIFHTFAINVLFSSFKLLVSGIDFMLRTTYTLLSTVFRLNLNFQEMFINYSNDINVKYHDSIDDIIAQQGLSDIEFVRDNNGNIIDQKGVQSPIVYYSSDEYKYGNNIYVPSYEDTVFLSAHQYNTRKRCDEQKID